MRAARVLVAGGAGYIGSHMVKALLGAGCEPTVLDDLSTGHRDLVRGGTFVEGSIADPGLLDAVMAHARFDAVMHFAARSLVGESAADPAAYWRGNACATLALLEAMRRHGVPRLVFSSTAAVYGEPARVPIAEDHPCAPVNPYGQTKLAVERMIADFAGAYGLRAFVLRYFNAAGADPEGGLGERHAPETHLIPLVLQCAAGERAAVSVFGADYPTPDGTCVRDYVHVCDLAAAHLAALARLLDGARGGTYNLGNSRGHSVREVIECAHAVTGRAIPMFAAPRRRGDPAILVADSARARAELDWRPRFEPLEAIVSSAWRWHAAEAARRQRGCNVEVRTRG
jgi:UDP-glucose-4-epimerase GalE